jgi:hypothetical protein
MDLGPRSPFCPDLAGMAGVNLRRSRLSSRDFYPVLSYLRD